MRARGPCWEVAEVGADWETTEWLTMQWRWLERRFMWPGSQGRGPRDGLGWRRMPTCPPTISFLKGAWGRGSLAGHSLTEGMA